jgi:hypothetical protein
LKDLLENRATTYCAVFHQATEHDVDFIDDRVGAFEGGRGSLDENVVLGDDGR